MLPLLSTPSCRSAQGRQMPGCLMWTLLEEGGGGGKPDVRRFSLQTCAAVWVCSASRCIPAFLQEGHA